MAGEGNGWGAGAAVAGGALLGGGAAVAGGALLGGVLDYFGSRRAQKRQEAILKKITGLTNQSIADVNDGFDRMFPHLTAAVDTLRSYSQRAIAANTQAGATASRIVAEQGRALAGDGAAALARRGLGSTTARTAAVTGANRETGRALGAIAEGVGARNASLNQSAGAQIASGQAALGNAYVDRARATSAIRGQLISQLGGTQYDYQGGGAFAGAQIGSLVADAWKREKR